jgi:hypothetical protein
MANKFLPGNPGSPGRPKGSRNKVAAAYFDTMLRILTEPAKAEPSGEMTKLEVMLREEFKKRPQDLLKGLRNSLPTEISFDSPVADLADEELERGRAKLREMLKVVETKREA